MRARSRFGPLSGASLVAAEVGMDGVGSAGEPGSCWNDSTESPSLPLVMEAWSPTFCAGSQPRGEAKGVSRVLAEGTGPGTAESQASPRTLCLSPQLRDNQLCSAVFVPRSPARPHHCPGSEPGQEHRGLPAVAMGHPVGHEHEHRPGHQNQPLHRGPAGGDRPRPPSARSPHLLAPPESKCLRPGGAGVDPSLGC